MINKEKIILRTQTYYTPTWSGVTAITIIKFFPDNKALVRAGNNTFIRPIKHIYNKSEHARVGRRNWEHDERKRKKGK